MKPKAEDPVAEKSYVEEPKDEKPKVGEPIAQKVYSKEAEMPERKTKDSFAEEQKIKEPNAAKSITEEAKTKRPNFEEPKSTAQPRKLTVKRLLEIEGRGKVCIIFPGNLRCSTSVEFRMSKKLTPTGSPY
jgi:hypothetical protein